MDVGLGIINPKPGWHSSYLLAWLRWEDTPAVAAPFVSQRVELIGDKDSVQMEPISAIHVQGTGRLMPDGTVTKQTL